MSTDDLQHACILWKVEFSYQLHKQVTNDEVIIHCSVIYILGQPIRQLLTSDHHHLSINTYQWPNLLWRIGRHAGMPPVCFDDVWMPPVHTQHKESMLYQTNGCPYAPIHLDCPPMFACTPCMFGHPPYVWMAPCMFGCSLDAPCTYTTQRKHALSD